jgi:hypothetical protein
MLMQIAPAVFENGVMPPASVHDATNDVMDENDVAWPVIEACLVADPNAVTPLSEIDGLAALLWLERRSLSASSRA